MTYNLLENSVQDGNPVELYEFRQGSIFWRYTSAAHPITMVGQVFEPEYIKRSAINQTDEISKNGLKLTFHLSNSFAHSFLGFAPEQITTVIIYRGHYDDSASEFVAYWKGRILSAKVDEQEITLDCESVFSSLKRPGLRARFERACRHTLYSTQCGLSMSSYAVEGIIQGVSTVNLTIGAAASYPDSYFTGGVVQSATGDLRFIVYHIGDHIKVSRVFNTAIGNTLVLLYPGCDKSKNTCINKFNNVLNFGGFPYIPSKNPFVGSVV